jgi:hypothetical protein
MSCQSPNVYRMKLLGVGVLSKDDVLTGYTGQSCHHRHPHRPAPPMMRAIFSVIGTECPVSGCLETTACCARMRWLPASAVAAMPMVFPPYIGHENTRLIGIAGG